MGDQELLTTCCITALAKSRPQLAIKRAHQFVDLARVDFVLTDLSLALFEHDIQSPLRDAGKPLVVTGDAMLVGENTAAKAGGGETVVRPAIDSLTSESEFRPSVDHDHRYRVRRARRMARWASG
jgi:hypothetical protein